MMSAILPASCCFVIRNRGEHDIYTNFINKSIPCFEIGFKVRGLCYEQIEVGVWLHGASGFYQVPKCLNIAANQVPPLS